MRWPVWAHLAWLTGLALVVDVGGELIMGVLVGGQVTEVLSRNLYETPTFLFGIFPVIAAISAGLSFLRRNAIRSAVWMSLAVSLGLVSLDLAGTPRAAWTPGTVASAGGQLVPTGPALDFEGVGAINTAWRVARGEMTVPAERLRSYPAGHPRVVATIAIKKGGFFLLPLLLAGVALGVQTWVLAHVVFPRSSDERVARVVLSWLVAPVCFAVLLNWTDRLYASTLFVSGSMWALLVPYLPLGVIGLLGWRAAFRSQIWREEIDTDPTLDAR